MLTSSPVYLVCVTLQGLHDRERAPVQLGQGQPRPVTLLAPVPHTLPLGDDRGKPKSEHLNGKYSITFILEHVVISDFRLFSPGVVFTVMTVLVAVNRDAITENGAHLSWSRSSKIQMGKIKSFCRHACHTYETNPATHSLS